MKSRFILQRVMNVGKATNLDWEFIFQHVNRNKEWLQVRFAENINYRYHNLNYKWTDAYIGDG